MREYISSSIEEEKRKKLEIDWVKRYAEQFRHLTKDPKFLEMFKKDPLAAKKLIKENLH